VYRDGGQHYNMRGTSTKIVVASVYERLGQHGRPKKAVMLSCVHKRESWDHYHPVALQTEAPPSGDQNEPQKSWIDEEMVEK
jgi:hypothetical protein